MNCDMFALSKWTWNTFPYGFAISPLNVAVVFCGLLFGLNGLLLVSADVLPVVPSLGVPSLGADVVIGAWFAPCAPVWFPSLVPLIFPNVFRWSPDALSCGRLYPE